MIHAEWMINLLTGPVVGSADRAHLHDAWEAIETAFREAIGEDWGPAHSEAVWNLRRYIMGSGEVTLAKLGRVEYRVPGVAVTLTRR